MGGVGCDNMTVILTCFLHGNTYTHLTERCSQLCPSPFIADPSATTSDTNCSAGECLHAGAFLAAPLSEGASSPYCRTDHLDLRGNVVRNGEEMSEMKHCNCQRNSELTKPQQLSCTV